MTIANAYPVPGGGVLAPQGDGMVAARKGPSVPD